MKTNLVRRIDIAQAQVEHAREILRREWLITNGLGGYASGTICGMVSRRYHGLLIAALPTPFGRVVMLNHLAESLRLEDGRSLLIGGEEPSRAGEADAQEHYVREFRVEDGLPIWVYEAAGFLIEKRLLLIHGQNAVHVSYRLLSGQDCARVELRPSVHFRPHERDVGDPLNEGYSLLIHGRRYEISSTAPPHPLRLYVHDEKACFIHDGGHVREIAYQTEADRGYRSRGVLWSPGAFTIELRPNRAVTFVASTEDWPSILALDPDEALAADLERRRRLIAAAVPSVRIAAGAELVLAADQFIITPAGRVEDAARAKAAGEEVRTIIAGYHWFTDWGRDTMISLEGLTLTTGRHHEAAWILRTFAHYVRDGLIPNLFPEGESEGLYHTADATLWFFHALDRYLEVTRRPRHAATAPAEARRDCRAASARDTLRHRRRSRRRTCCARARKAISSRGWTRRSMAGWSRRGAAKPSRSMRSGTTRCVCSQTGCAEEQGADAARPFAEHAQRAHESFNRRFWSEERGYLARYRGWRTGRRSPLYGRIKSSPSRCVIRCSTKRTGLQSSKKFAPSCSRPWDCGRSRAGIPITNHATSATCAREMPRIIKEPFGPG